MEAIIDTGFNGFLTLPPALVAALGLPWLCRQQGQLADGSVNGFGVRLLNSSYNARRTRIASSFAKSFGVNTFLWMIEK